MKRNNSVNDLVKSMVVNSCALHNLCEGHGQDYQNDLGHTCSRRHKSRVCSNISTGHGEGGQGCVQGSDAVLDLLIIFCVCVQDTPLCNAFFCIKDWAQCANKDEEIINLCFVFYCDESW